MAQGLLGVILGAGVLIGAVDVLHRLGDRASVASRAVPATGAASVLGIVTAVGSLGALIAAPIGQGLAEAFRLARRRARLRRPGARHAAGGLVRRPGRRVPLPAAADDIGTPRPQALRAPRFAHPPSW